jgi:hypothetical protein
MPARCTTASGAPIGERRRAVHRAGRLAEAVHRLPQIVEVDPHEVAERLGWRREVHVHHAVAMRQEFADHGAAGLAAAAGDDHAPPVLSRHVSAP